MDMNATELKVHPLTTLAHYAGGSLPRRSVADGRFLRPEDPALLAVTDFTREHPVTVDADRQIDDALDDMIRVGVRALLVYHESRIVGLITSYDIQGERPIQFLQSSNYRHHRDIRVADIMTTWDQLPALHWAALQNLSAGELRGLLEEASVSHLIVVQADGGDEGCVVRALISRARLARQLSGGAHGG